MLVILAFAIIIGIMSVAGLVMSIKDTKNIHDDASLLILVSITGIAVSIAMFTILFIKTNI